MLDKASLYVQTSYKNDKKGDKKDNGIGCMLELIGENDIRRPCIVKNECSDRKCYRCDKFSRCIILNNGGDLLPSNSRRKAK